MTLYKNLLEIFCFTKNGALYTYTRVQAILHVAEAEFVLPFPLTLFSSCGSWLESVSFEWCVREFSRLRESLHFHTPALVYVTTTSSASSLLWAAGGLIPIPWRRSKVIFGCVLPVKSRPRRSLPGVNCHYLVRWPDALQSLPVASACPTGSEDVVLPAPGPGAWDCCCWYWANCWRCLLQLLLKN